MKLAETSNAGLSDLSLAPPILCIAGALFLRMTDMFAKSRNLVMPNPVAPTSEVSLLEAAAQYRQISWSLIPLLGKQPAIPQWKPYQAVPPNAEELEAWFSHAPIQPTGLGLITGRVSRLIVVDCDTPEDATFWLTNYPQSPLTVHTGRGGAHVYYRSPLNEPVPNRVRVLGRQIDVRGEGGYVAAPPSRHPMGTQYTWSTSGVKLDQPLPPFEVSWLPAPAALTTLQFVGSSNAVRSVVAYLSRIQAVSGEGGHNATFRAASKLRDAGLPAEEALEILSRWNETNATPPWSEAELWHKIQSAYQVGKRRV